MEARVLVQRRYQQPDGTIARLYSFGANDGRRAIPRDSLAAERVPLRNLMRTQSPQPAAECVGKDSVQRFGLGSGLAMQH
jgi:hypothetical protein